MAAPLLTPCGTPATTADRVLVVIASAIGGALIGAIVIKGFVFALT